MHPTGERYMVDEMRCEEMTHALRRPRSRAATPSVEFVGEYPSSLIPFQKLACGRPSSMYKSTPETSQEDKEEVNTPAPATKADTPAPFEKGVHQQEVTKKTRHRLAMTPIAENNGASGSSMRWESGPQVAKLPGKRPRKKEWEVPRDTFRPLSISPSTNFVLLGYVDDLKSLANLVASPARNSVTNQIVQINAYLKQATAAGDGSFNLLRTPAELRDKGYSFREVIDSKAMWRSWDQPPNNPLRIIVFSNIPEAVMINGFATFQVPSDIIIHSSSESEYSSDSDDNSEPESDSPRSATGSSLDSGDEKNDEGGKGMATETPAEEMAMDVPNATAGEMATSSGDQASMDIQTA
jgi:hypothetical protein